VQVSQGTAPDSRTLRRAFQILIGLLTVVLGGLIFRYEIEPQSTWRPALFDALQRAYPRDARTAQVAVVAIDETTLNKHGRWPWPRGQLGELLGVIGSFQPDAIGLDITLREADDHERWLRSLYNATDALADEIRALPTQDEVLAYYMRQLPIVLSRQGTDLERTQVPGAVPDWPIQLEQPLRAGQLVRFPTRLTNVPALENFAAGFGYTNSDVGKDAVARRVPVILEVGDAVVPSFALELIRVAAGANWLTVKTQHGAPIEVEAGGLTMPVDADGQILIRYAPYQPQAWIPAHALLAGDTQAQARLRAADIVIVGVTALDLTDAVATPVWASAIGVDVHLQALENLLLDARVVRPTWAPWAEYLYVVCLLVAAATLMGRATAAQATIGLVVAALMPAAGAGVAFSAFSLQLDPSWPVITAIVLAGAGLLTQLRLTRLHAAQVSAFLARERTERARLSGELDAAREIQMGMLPVPESVPVPANVALYAALRPAREVGGDLYDMFMLDERRLFFVVGDVAGKGVPASLFMALGKTLCKSNALRGQFDLDQLVCIANEEISRDNPGMMFITAMFGVLDTQTGALEFCNAGHDTPLVVHADGSTDTLEGAGGPPLCVMDDFPYLSEATNLQPGDTLVVVTDGITEAHNQAGELFGRERLVASLTGLAHEVPASMVEGLVSQVDQFAGAAEQFDDLTVFAVKFDAGA
jgi:adenylate cyclase